MNTSDIRSNRAVVSVSDLTRNARQLLEGEFPNVFVEGEISNFSTPASGHWYFTLKDAKSQIRCAMFKGKNRLIRFVPRNGLQIVARGKISLYEGRGDFQMITEYMEEAGDGALKRAFERLQNKLEHEGLFAEENKLPLPSLVQHLAVITSPTGAAVRDVLHVLARRFPAMQVTIIPAQVQGDDSVPQLVNALQTANQSDINFDAILLTRGGGSLEDLWSFNTEPVARAIAESTLPIVSAVGHETDFTIADFVADARAPTPSAAAEMLSPDTAHWLTQLRNTEAQLHRVINQKQNSLAASLKHLKKRLRHPGHRLQDLHQRLDDIEARMRSSLQPYLNPGHFQKMELRLNLAAQRYLDNKRSLLNENSNRLVNPGAKIQAMLHQLEQANSRLHHEQYVVRNKKAQRLSELGARLDGISPLKTLARGYAIVSKDQSVLKDTASLAVGDQVKVQLADSNFEAAVSKI